jgi:hypothetical protein
MEIFTRFREIDPTTSNFTLVLISRDQDHSPYRPIHGAFFVAINDKNINLTLAAP